jgi:hypothetical protein
MKTKSVPWKWRWIVRAIYWVSKLLIRFIKWLWKRRK